MTESALKGVRRRVARYVAITAAGAMVVIGLVSLAPDARAYPPPMCAVTVKPQVLRPGQTFTVSGRSTGSVHWTVHYRGATVRFTGASFSTTLRAPSVPGTYGLSVTCQGSDGSVTSTFNIQVLGGPGRGGPLPNTGGPDLWWLIAALGALCSGGLLLARDRKRRRVA